MGRVIWVEVLGRHGVAHRVRATALPLVIGRGYQADVVVDDPLVDARHLRLDDGADGGLLIEDLGTVNGTHLEDGSGRSGRLLRGASSPLPPGALVRVGQTRLRLATGETPVPPALAEPAGGGRVWRALTAARAAVLVPAAGCTLGALDLWLGDAEGRAAGSLAGDALGLLLVVAAWAGGWALAGRVAGRPSRFGAHHAFAWAFLLVAGVLATLVEWGDFLVPGRALTGLGIVAAGALFVALLSAHLALVSRAGRRHRLLIAVLVTVALAGASALIERAARLERGDELTLTAALKPAPAGLVPADPVAGFLERARGVRQTVDRLAARDGRRVRPGSRSGP